MAHQRKTMGLLVLRSRSLKSVAGTRQRWLAFKQGFQ